MNRKIFVLVTVLAVVFVASKHQLFAQSNKNNGTLEIISAYVPDSVVFKPAEGIEIAQKSLVVFLVSGTTDFRVGNFWASGSTKLSPSGEFIFYDKTILCAFDFKVPSYYKVEKIKFVVDNKEMIYDFANFKWESDSEEKDEK